VVWLLIHANDRSQQEPRSNGSPKFKPVSVRPLLLYAYRIGFIWCCKMGDYGPQLGRGCVVGHGRGAGGEGSNYDAI